MEYKESQNSSISNSKMNKTFIQSSDNSSSNSFSFDGKILNDVFDLKSFSNQPINNDKISPLNSKNEKINLKHDTSKNFISLINNLSFSDVSNQNSKQLNLSPTFDFQILNINNKFNSTNQNNYTKNFKKEKNNTFVTLNKNKKIDFQDENIISNKFHSFKDDLDFEIDLSNLTDFKLTKNVSIPENSIINLSKEQNNCWNVPKNEQKKDYVWWEEDLVKKLLIKKIPKILRYIIFIKSMFLSIYK